MERSGSMEKSAHLMELKKGQRSCSGLHKLKDLQGPEKLGITTGHWRDGRYQTSLPADRFLIRLQPKGAFFSPVKMGRGMLQVVFLPHTA